MGMGNTPVVVDAEYADAVEDLWEECGNTIFPEDVVVGDTRFAANYSHAPILSYLPLYGRGSDLFGFVTHATFLITFLVAFILTLHDASNYELFAACFVLIPILIISSSYIFTYFTYRRAEKLGGGYALGFDMVAKSHPIFASYMAEFKTTLPGGKKPSYAEFLSAENRDFAIEVIDAGIRAQSLYRAGKLEGFTPEMEELEKRWAGMRVGAGPH